MTRSKEEKMDKNETSLSDFLNRLPDGLSSRVQLALAEEFVIGNDHSDAANRAWQKGIERGIQLERERTLKGGKS